MGDWTDGSLPFPLYQLTAWQFSGTISGSDLPLTTIAGTFFAQPAFDTGRMDIDTAAAYSAGPFIYASAPVWATDEPSEPPHSNVPEPGSVLLVATGFTGIVALKRYSRLSFRRER